MPTDNEIIKQIREGSEKAFRVVYDAHYKLMLGVGINITKDIDSAKEVVQEVFYQFWKNREKIKDGISIRNYLKRAVINRCINHIKYNARFTGDEQLEHTQTDTIAPDQQMEVKELKAVIDAAVAKLPEKARVIFILRRHEGLSLKEIAEKLDISPKTVENQITRALKILKSEIEPFLKKTNAV
ncbi:MAG: RNA polymerase sigma-70 factor [Crocinitomix sp.]|nr:RNA polymerase sigma-70 factor [Crocinitomix sp.]